MQHNFKTEHLNEKPKIKLRTNIKEQKVKSIIRILT